MRALTWQRNEDVEVLGLGLVGQTATRIARELGTQRVMAYRMFGDKADGCIKVVLQPERQPL
jgi:threonine dehydrogenase-like Zn-dependent dehydrogenase